MNDIVFYEGGEFLPKLYLYQSLFENPYTILVTLKDTSGNHYLGSNSYRTANYVEWIIVLIEEETLHNMLGSKITIRQAFNSECYVTLRLNNNLEYIEKVYNKVTDYLDRILSTEGFYWN